MKELEMDPWLLTPILLVTVFIWIFAYLSRRYKHDRVIITVFSLGFLFYSGIGIAYKQAEIKFLFAFFAFYLAFILFYCIFSGNKFPLPSSSRNKLLNKSTIDNLYLKYWNIVNYLGIAHLIFCISFLVFPEFRLLEIFSFNFQYNSINHLELRSARGSQTYTLISYCVLLTRPFFFLWIYKFRKNKYTFIFLVILPIYLQFVFDHYLPRNDIVLWGIFLLAFLYSEKHISKKFLFIFSSLFVLVGMPLLTILSSLRVGQEINFSILNYSSLFKEILSQETWYPIMYQYAVDSHNNVPTLLYFLWIILLPIPTFIVYKVFGYINFPILSYIFTTQATGYTVYDSNYYIVLPSVLGEGLMLFGTLGSWIYSIIYAFIIACMIRVFKNNIYTKYWFFYYALDLFRMMRGGSQSFIAQTVNSLPLLLLILVVIKIIEEKQRTPKKKLAIS